MCPQGDTSSLKRAQTQWFPKEYEGNVQKVCSTAVEYFTVSWVLVIAKISHWNNIYKHILDLHKIRSWLSDLYPIRCRKRGIFRYTLNILTESCRHEFFFQALYFLNLTMMNWKSFWWEIFLLTYHFFWVLVNCLLITDWKDWSAARLHAWN